MKTPRIYVVRACTFWRCAEAVALVNSTSKFLRQQRCWKVLRLMSDILLITKKFVIPKNKMNSTLSVRMKFSYMSSLLLGGRLPLFDLLSLLNIHLPPKIGKLPLFGPHLLPIIFPIKKSKFYWIFQWKCIVLKVNKLSTKYNVEMFLHHIMSYTLIKRGNMSPC